MLVDLNCNAVVILKKMREAIVNGKQVLTTALMKNALEKILNWKGDDQI